MRLAGVVIAFAVLLGAFTGSASANVTIWRVSVAGSYRSDATITAQECGQDSKTPMTATSSETGTLRTNKATLFDVLHEGKKPLLQIENDMKLMKLAGSKT